MLASSNLFVLIQWRWETLYRTRDKSKQDRSQGGRKQPNRNLDFPILCSINGASRMIENEIGRRNVMKVLPWGDFAYHSKRISLRRWQPLNMGISNIAKRKERRPHDLEKVRAKKSVITRWFNVFFCVIFNSNFISTLWTFILTTSADVPVAALDRLCAMFGREFWHNFYIFSYKHVVRTNKYNFFSQ